MNLILYDKAHIKVGLLEKVKDLKIESVLSTGDKTLSFSVAKDDINLEKIEYEGYLRTTNDEFVIKEINDNDDFYDIVAVLNLDDLEGMAWDRFNSQESTIENALNLALAGTGWSIGINTVGTKKRTIQKTYCSSLDILKEICKIYLAEIKYDTINKTVSVYTCIGSNQGEYLMDTVNAKKIERQSDSYDFYTKLIAVGATLTEGEGDNATSTTLTCTVTNNEYSNKVKTCYWKDERYTILANLQEDAQAKLDEMAKPSVAYKVSIAKLGNVSLGDKVWLISKDKKIREELRVVKLIEYPNELYNNSCELGNKIYSFEDIQNANRQTANTVNNITTGDDGSVSPSAIKDALDKAIIAELDVASLNALEIRVGNIEASYIKTTGLVTVKAEIQDAVIENLQADNIFANYEEVNVLKANVETVNTLLGGTVVAGSTQTIVLNSQNITVADGTFKSAMIESLDVSKLNAGVISTNKFTIQSNDGAITIADNTMQFKDNNDNVRIQMGQDSSGNFSFIIRASDGQTTLIDGTGVKENAIADKLIKTKMVADNAITGKKIDWDDFFTTINTDGTHTLNSSKVKLNSNNQTLDVAFNQMTTKINNIGTGRNYCRKGWFINQDTSGRATKEITKDSSYDFIVKFTKLSSEGWGILTNNQKIKFTYGKKYTLSFKACTETLNNIQVRICSTSSTDIVLFPAVINLNTDGKFHDYKLTFEAKTSTSEYLQFMSDNGQVALTQIKLEEGEKATDYTEAIEDTENRISTNSTNISVMQGQISTLISQTSQITNNTDNITTLTTNYSALNQTVNSLNTTVSSHTSSISSLNTTVSSHTSSISQLQSSIALKVEKTDITAAINGLQIGGRNYCRKGWYINQDINGRATITSGKNDTYDYVLTFKKLSAEGWGILTNSYKIKFEYGKKYTLSFKARTTTLSNIQVRICSTSSTDIVLFPEVINLNNDGKYHDYKLTFDAKTSTSEYLQFMSDNGEIVLAQIKLEEGEKATSFTEAEEDIDIRFSSVEQKITPDALTVTISNGLKGTDSIETDKFTFDKDGVHIFNGGLDITNKANAKVFSCDTDGDLVLRGTFTNYDKTTGYLACKIEDTQIKFYNFKEQDKLIGSLGSTVRSTDSSKAFISLWHELDNRIIVGYRKPTDNLIYPYFECEYGVLMNFKALCNFDSSVNVTSLSFIKNVTDTGHETGASITQTVLEDNTIFLQVSHGLKVTRDFTTLGNAIIAGNMTASGSKNCLQQTEHYGGRLFYSLEDCSSYLTDRVDIPVQVNSNRQIKVEFNEIFKECVNLTNYQITINKESYGDYTILEKTEDYFILESDTEGFKFTYTITAKRKGYEDRYLDEFKTA